MKRREIIELRSLIEKSVQHLDNNDALTAKILHPSFESLIGQTVKKGFRFTYDDKLWSVAQPELTIQAHYLPGVGMESLYEEVCETHSGTLDDPVPYNGNMILENGKYYSQNDAMYLCIRDSISPVQHALSELIGLYVEKI